jgi:hypothetical protein
MYELKRKIYYRILRMFNHLFTQYNKLFIYILRIFTLNTPLTFNDIKVLNKLMRINAGSHCSERQSYFPLYYSFHDQITKKIESTSSKRNYWTYKFLYSLLISRGFYSLAFVFKNEIISFITKHQRHKLSSDLCNELFLLNLENVDFKIDNSICKEKVLDKYNTILRNAYHLTKTTKIVTNLIFDLKL